MVSQRWIESFVGIFLIFSIIAFCILALKVSGLTTLFPLPSYSVKAAFTEIGGLKIKAPVKIGGVPIGEVSDIYLDPTTFKAVVKLKIKREFNNIPNDSTAGILTAGLLGDNYIEILPMYNKIFLKEGDEIQSTQSAIVLEKLIGQFIYKMGNSGGNNAD
jgi:phospholipid/cholesterol/gamma-HCH transport system substrate-binding protein